MPDPVHGPVRAFAPATVSNVGCGFDVLGFAIEAPGDVVVAEPLDEPGVRLLGVTGDGGRLPRDAATNTAGVAARALLENRGLDGVGVGLRLEKGMPIGSGLGSSAASAVAAVRAVDALLGLEASREELLAAALEGERAACGAAHADNAAPSVWGGIVLVRAHEPPDVVELPVPEGLSCAVVKPRIEISTRAARDALAPTVPLADAVAQWGNLGALVAALFTGDLELLGRSLVDRVAEPRRAALVDGFEAARDAALGAGALGAGLSGSGPSIFALSAGRREAEEIAEAMVGALAAVGVASDRWVSAVGCPGARILDESAAGDSADDPTTGRTAGPFPHPDDGQRYFR